MTPTYHYGAAPGVAVLREMLEVDQRSLGRAERSMFALETMLDFDDGALREFARRHAPDHVDELELADPLTVEDAERVLGLLGDVAARVEAAVARGETERDETGVEHFARRPQDFRPVASVAKDDVTGWLRGTAGAAARMAPRVRIAPQRAASRTGSRPRGAGRPCGQASRSSAANGDSGSDDGPAPPSRPFRDGRWRFGFGRLARRFGQDGSR